MESMNIVERYSRDRPRYERFCEEVADLISKLLKKEDLSVHTISKRCKTVDSLRGKVERKQTYGLLEDVTDLVGIRVITYYSADVDKIAELIRSEFDIDWAQSVDKRATIDPDQFGYLSLHYVASLNSERSALREYEAYADLKFEIQMRSILQHAWAEIEHDSGYKSAFEVPRNVRRAFSRLAGLLELADEEFNSVRDKISVYEDEVRRELQKGSNKLALDKVSYVKFVDASQEVARIDKRVADTMGAVVLEGGNIDSVLDRFKVVGIDDLESLEHLLAENESAIMLRVEQVKESVPDPSNFNPPKGISLVLLTQVLAAKSDDPNLIDRYVEATTKNDDFKIILRDLRKRIRAG